MASALPAAVPLIRDTTPAATIILPDSAPPSLRLAAEELNYHLANATGAKLPILTESALASSSSLSPPTAPADARIYLGDTQAARAAGISASTLAPETFTLRTVSTRDLIVAGRDTGGDPLDRDASAGTLFGVYEWLERDLGVRWAWPGELGTHVPPARTVTARDVDVTLSPRFFQRHLRSGLSFKADHPALGFTAAAAADYARDQTLFLRRHRMGRGERLSYGHAFTNWWQRFGKEHPEWFQLVNGKRGPTKPTARYSMCVSEPSLHREIVAQWRARGAPNYINVVENDILGQCECANCRAWDGPAPADANQFYSPNFKVYGSRFVSDRYARFALAVQQLAAKENPKVTAVSYVYFNYFQAPTSDVKLNANVLLGYCPSAGWYPRLDDEHAWYKAQWSGWRETGARLFSRTNYFLDGYCMPFIFAHQFADDFQHQARQGMIATDFDSLTGHWATQGPNLYLLLRLHTHPDASPDTLLAEYYSTFGPAGAAVKAYFDYWETYATENRPLINEAFADRVAIRWRTWAKATHVVFPEKSFTPAQALLAKARLAAASDAPAAARVEFLQLGLTHAQLCARVSQLLSLADPTVTPERGAAALQELLAFRRAHERTWLSNLNHNAWVEDLSWKLSAQTKQEPELYP
ncbi:MAG: DUF4838 domain-containing protein [Verrucomicrobiota bacterium]